MKNTLKKIFAGISALTIIIAGSLTTSGNYQELPYPQLENYTVFDDKGMLWVSHHSEREGYKIICDGAYFSVASPLYNEFKFILREDVSSEETDRVNEIFSGFFDFTPYTETYDNLITYSAVYCKEIISPDDERMKEVKEKTKLLMQQLNDENLISAFYDVGEIHEVSMLMGFEKLQYKTKADAELANNYIEENNLDYVIKNGCLVSNNETTLEERFLAAIDIYEATGAAIEGYYIAEDSNLIYGKNTLEDLSSETTSITSTTTSETTTTTVSTTVTTQLTEMTKPAGDADGDNEITVRDAAFIAAALAQGKNNELIENADFNGDGNINVRDAAAIARVMAEN